MMTKDRKIEVKFYFADGDCSTEVDESNLSKMVNILNKKDASRWLVIEGNPEMWVKIEMIQFIAFTLLEESDD